MSYAAAFLAVASRHGQRISLERDGEILGSGLALLRPLFDPRGQFLPTDPTEISAIDTTSCI